MIHFFKKWRKSILLSLLFSSFCFTLGFFYQYHLPRLHSWLLVEIENQTRKNLPLRVWPKQLRIRLFPPQIILNEVKIIPQTAPEESFVLSSIHELKLKINWIALFKGQLRLSELAISEVKIDVLLPQLFSAFEAHKNNKENFIFPTFFNLNSVYRLPCDRLSIDQLNLTIRSKLEDEKIIFKEASLTIDNMFNALMIETHFPKVYLSKGRLPSMQLALESLLLIDNQNLQISALKVKQQSSYLVTSGYIKGNFSKGMIDSGNMSMRTHFALPEVRLLAQDYLGKTGKIPHLKGTTNISLEMKWSESKYPEMKIRTESHGVSINHYLLGDLKGEGQITKDNILISSLNIQNSAGKLNLEKIELEKKDPGVFAAEVNIAQLELRQLLLNLNIPEVPLHLDLSGVFPCQGQLSPLKVECKGKVFGKNLNVHSGKSKKFNILDLKEMSAEGVLNLDQEKVKYNASIQVGENSRGRSEGTIDYQDGFKINYEADTIDFKDIQNLAQLQLEGNAQLKGSTEGNSHYGTIKMNLETKNFWLENFGLGRINSELKYQDGKLSFNQMKGLFGSTQYQGELSLDLFHHNIHILGQLPFVDLRDLKTIFSRKYKLPIEIDGIGKAKIKISGPLVLRQLDFDLQSSFSRCVMANEAFDEFAFNAQGRGGHIRISHSFLNQSPGRMSLEGVIKSDGEMNLSILGQHLRLEQSENLKKLRLNISGSLDFSTSLLGSLSNPRTEVQGHLSQLIVGEQPKEDSQFNLSLNSQAIQGRANLMDNVIKTEFYFPFNDDNPFRLFIETNELNFAQVFSVFAGANQKKDFDAKLSSVLDLRSERGGIFSSSGFININSFYVKRGNMGMSIPSPVLLKVKNGMIHSSQFDIEGQGTLMSFLIKNTSKDEMNMSFNGKMDMGLALLFLPFLEDLRGHLSLSGQLRGNWNHPELLGSAFIEKGLVRLPDFPQAFDNIHADLLFNHKNIVINNSNGQLGGGNFNAEGKIQLEGIREVPIDINGRFKDVSLTIPEGVKTKGSGNFFLKGNWFPYTLGGELNIHHGEVNKEMGQNNQKVGRIKPSSFLPRFMIEDRFQPIILDWKVNFLKPVLVKNSLIQSPISGNLAISGKVSDPILKGQLSFEKEGKIFFHETPFDVSVGRVEFFGEETENPQIFLTGNTRVKDKYDINLLIQGRARDPQINLSSQPPLTDAEIISLLALGVLPNTEDKVSAGNELATQTTLQLSSALLQKPLGDINKLTGVELDVSGTTNTDRTVVPNLTLKKQWSPKFGISASRTVENKPLSNAKVEYKFNKRFSVIGTWENKEGTPEIKDTASEKIGLDLEYRLEFK